MAKQKKPSLKDVSSFLKKQPHTFVEIKNPGIEKSENLASSGSLSVQDLTHLINSSNTHNTKGELLIDLIINTLDSEENQSPEEIMLVNTAYFLKYSLSKK